MLSFISGSIKTKIIFGLIIFIIGSVVYYTLVLNYTKSNLDKVKTELVVSKSTTGVKVSEAINHTRYEVISKAVISTEYNEAELPVDYVDPDYGRVIKFGGK